MKIQFISKSFSKLSSGTLVLGVFEGKVLTSSAKRINVLAKGLIVNAMKSGAFNGKTGDFLFVRSPKILKITKILLVGLGKAEKVDSLLMQSLGGGICERLNTDQEKTAWILLDSLKGQLTEKFVYLATGLRLRSYRFNKYFAKKKEGKDNFLQAVNMLVSNPSQTKSAFSKIDKVTDGVFLTRDLISEPSNVIYPSTLAKEAQRLSALGVKVEVLDEAKMRKLGMGSLLCVGQGSEKPSKLVVMQWNGSRKGKNKRPVAFVGKGVTFDTGGISIKPSNGMEEMKYDMGGSGVVIGLMKALAGRKAKVNAVGVVGLVENMPSGSAVKPGDIVTSMSGQTIEVLNTDAEGRLVLADALWYCQNRFNPRFIVDLATLTGAIIVALGEEYAGLFSNDNNLADQIVNAGLAIGEKVWRLPLGDNYDKLLDSPVADIQNITNQRGAGSITAAQFLQRFVNKTPWAHLDIAGVTWASKDKDIVPKGATGYGVHLLNRLVSESYEEK